MSTQTDTNELNPKSSVAVQTTDDFLSTSASKSEEAEASSMNLQESKFLSWE